MKNRIVFFVLSGVCMLVAVKGYCKDQLAEKQVVGQCLTVSAGQEQQVLRVAQICDTQLGGFVSIDTSVAIFENAVRQINALAPDMVLIAGDMVDNINDDDEIEAFMRICARLQVPVLLTPGNHDLLEPVTVQGLAYYRSHFGDDFQVARCKGYCIVSINTSLWRSPPSEESSRHDSLLHDALQQAKTAGEPVVILSHAPPFVTSVDEDDEYYNLPIANREKTLRLFEESGVVFWIAGHLHKTLQRNFGQIAILNGESTCANFDGHPRGFRLLTVNSDRSFEWEFFTCE